MNVEFHLCKFAAARLIKIWKFEHADIQSIKDIFGMPPGIKSLDDLLEEITADLYLSFNSGEDSQWWKFVQLTTEKTTG